MYLFKQLFFLILFVAPSMAATEFCDINKGSLSLNMMNNYASRISPAAANAIELFSNKNASLNDVEKAFEIANKKELLSTKMLNAPAMQKSEHLGFYRTIIEDEPTTTHFHSYHGYHKNSALMYDIFTTIAAVLNDNNDIQPRSRFRFNTIQKPYASAQDFLENEVFYNDHEENFKIHGISAVPHLFSCSALLGETPLLAFLWSRSNVGGLEQIIQGIGCVEAHKYIDLMNQHLKGGFITRFTFHSTEAFDQGTYPAPLAIETQRYGLPCTLQGQRLTSSQMHALWQNFNAYDDKTQDFLFNMQLRNIYGPVYTDASKVTTQIFSSEESDLTDYYKILKAYIIQDMQGWTEEQHHQAELWLK